MTTLTEINEARTEYEPSVDDKIQRILYRLEHGEVLISRNLRVKDNFCVLGLFADESGLGEWYPFAELFDTDADEMGTYFYEINSERDNLDRSADLLNKTLIKHYSLHDCCGSFNFYGLPKDLQNKLDPIMEIGKRDISCLGVSLYVINDILFETGYYDPATSNQLLADVIRSGIIFESDTKEQA